MPTTNDNPKIVPTLNGIRWVTSPAFRKVLSQLVACQQNASTDPSEIREALRVYVAAHLTRDQKGVTRIGEFGTLENLNEFIKTNLPIIDAAISGLVEGGGK